MPPFVTTDEFLLLARTAEKFGQRPSALVGTLDPVMACDFDCAAYVALAALEMEQNERAAAAVKGEQWPQPDAHTVQW